MNNFINNEVDQVVKTVEGAGKQFGKIVQPIRHTAFRRFPTLFALLTTFGFAATLYGMEGVITRTPWLFERPWLMILFGVGILILTGRLHKKLD